MKLTFHNVTFERASRPLFSHIQGELQAGDCLHIQGANGSGKSTLLRILAGLMEPQAGTVCWQGHSIFAVRASYQQQLHYIGHKNGIKPPLTTYENIQLQCALRNGEHTPEELEAILKQLRLENLRDTQAMHLSAGQLRRLSLAKLLLQKTAVWILDEPLTALDSAGQDYLLQLCQEHLAQQGILIIATHQDLALEKIKTVHLNKKTVPMPSLAVKPTPLDEPMPNLATLSRSIATTFYHEIKTILRQACSWLTPLLFFVIVVCLFPLALGPDPVLLHTIAPGILWVAALLATIISMGNVFRQDEQEGYLDLLALSPLPLSLLILSKLLSHWATHCLPFILISPVLGALLQLTLLQELTLITALLLGTPVLCLLGGVGAALLVGLRNHGLLLPILIMPFYIPVLIFGTSALLAAGFTQPLSGYFAIMGALFLLSSACAPFLTSIALRNGVSQ